MNKQLTRSPSEPPQPRCAHCGHKSAGHVRFTRDCHQCASCGQFFRVRPTARQLLADLRGLLEDAGR